jgi:hypothetical protein
MKTARAAAQAHSLSRSASRTVRLQQTYSSDAGQLRPLRHPSGRLSQISPARKYSAFKNELYRRSISASLHVCALPL